MCGRYTHLFTWEELHRLLGLVHWPEVELTPRYNVAPTQLAPIVRVNARGERVGVMLGWGLVPSWADELSVGSRMMNARSESVFEKPAFRSAARERRCVVPISGFYEWQTVLGERIKRPHWIGRQDKSPLCLAGVWECWRGRGPGGDVETFSLLTTSPNEMMKPLHDRMPVILEKRGQDLWLDPSSTRPALEGLFAPYAGVDLVSFRVGRGVNGVAKDEPGLMAPVVHPPSSPGLFEMS